MTRRVRSPRLWILALLAVAGAAGGYGLARWKRELPRPETLTAVPRELIREVSATGRVRAREEVTVSVETSGRIALVPVTVGDAVAEGDLLVSLDAEILVLDVAEAEATLASARVSSEDAVRHATDARTNILVANIVTFDKFRQAVRNAKIELDQTEEVRQQEIRESGDESARARTALLNVRKAQSVFASARAAFREELAVARQREDEAAKALERANAELAEVLQAARSAPGQSVLGARALRADAHRRRAEVRAPIAGIVSAVEAMVGEFASVAEPLVTILTAAPHDVVAELPEYDAVTLSVGQRAEVTLDAYGPATRFEAIVRRIDPAGTLIEGVTTFRTTLAIRTDDPRIKPGMTANLVVRASAKDAVLAVPQRALITKQGRTIMRILRSEGTIEEREVETGLRGSDGFVEITKNLASGEQVVLFLPEEARAPGNSFGFSRRRGD